MSINVRMITAMLGGLLCMLVAVMIEGLHPHSIVVPRGFLMVGGTATGLLVAVRGLRTTWFLCKAALFVPRGDRPEREALVGAAEVLERASFLGGFLGLTIGVASAIGAADRPHLIGPGIALALSSLIYCFSLNAFFVLPLKHQLVHEVQPVDRLAPRDVPLRILRTYAVAIGSLAILWLCRWQGLAVGMLPSALVLVAGLGPSVLAARDPILTGPVSQRRQLWYSDAVISAGMLALCCGLVHVCQVLESPELATAGLAYSLSQIAIPVACAVIIRLPPTHESPGVSELRRSRNLYFGFAGLSVAALAWLAIVVILILGNMESPEPGLPR